MVPFINTMLIFMGFSVFYLRNARVLYFELALSVFASIFMAAILILSQQYSMLGKIYFPLFYWGFFILPLFLFSQSRVLCCIWAFLFFTGFFYWLADADILNSGFIFQYRTLVLFLLFPFIGLLYLLSELVQTNQSMQQALKACLYISFLSVFLLMDFSALLASDKYLAGTGFAVMSFNICLVVVSIAAGLIIGLFKRFTFKQKILLIGFILFLLGSVFSPNYFLRLILLQLVLINLLLFYASIQFRLATDTLAVIASMHLSLTLFKIIFPQYLFYLHYFYILSLFIVSISFYFLIIRRKIL